MKVKTLSAGVVVVRQTSEGGRYLVLRVYDYWDFPKGVVEADEDPVQAACREVEEETTLKNLDFRWGHVYLETESYGRGKVARYYLAQTQETEVRLPVSPKLGRPEHDEYRWLRYEKARPLLSPRLASVLDWAHELTGC